MFLRLSAAKKNLKRDIYWLYCYIHPKKKNRLKKKQYMFVVQDGTLELFKIFVNAINVVLPDKHHYLLIIWSSLY